jgi:O-antigen/teichoic acid export membrane protein
MGRDTEGTGAQVGRLVGRAGVVGLSRLVGAGLTFGAQLLLARWMGPDALGVYVLVFAVCTILALVCGLGLPSAAPRFLAEAQAANEPGLVLGFIKRSREITVGFSLALSAGAVIAAIVYPLSVPFSPTVILPAAIMLPLMAVTRLQVMFELSLGRPAHAFMPEFTLRPTLFLLLLTALWFSVTLGAPHALWAQALAIACTCAVQFWLFRTAPVERPSGERLLFRTRAWLITAAPLLAFDVFTSYFAEINVLLLGTMAPPGDVAVFHVAFRIAMLIGIGIHAIESAMLADTARHRARGDSVRLRQSIAEANTVRLCGGAAGVAVLIAIGPSLLSLFGPAFDTGRFALVVLLLGQLIAVMAGPAAQVLSVSGGERDCACAVVLALMMTIGLQAALVPVAGLDGAAAAALGGTITWNLALLWFVHRRLGFVPIELRWPVRHGARS